VPIEEMVEAAIQRYHQADWKCVQAPAECDPAAFLASQGSARQLQTDALQQFIDRGWYVGVDLGGAYMRVESVAEIGSGVATALSCRYDAGTVFGPPGPDGQPTIVADVPTSYMVENTLYLENGEWLVGRGVRTQELGDGDQCAG
jgi:hypothetical protein